MRSSPMSSSFQISPKNSLFQKHLMGLHQQEPPLLHQQTREQLFSLGCQSAEKLTVVLIPFLPPPSCSWTNYIQSAHFSICALLSVVLSCLRFHSFHITGSIYAYVQLYCLGLHLSMSLDSCLFIYCTGIIPFALSVALHFSTILPHFSLFLCYITLNAIVLFALLDRC